MIYSLNSQVQILLQTYTSQSFPIYSLRVKKADVGKILPMFRDTARGSISSHMPKKSLELKHTIKLIQEFTVEIDEIEAAIKRIMDEEIQSPILTIPGISYRTGAMIIAEIGDFNRFDSANKILKYAGMSPSTYQSGQLNNGYSHMEKLGSKYLRYDLYNTTKYVCHWDESFGAYLQKKRSEGKHYNVALSHATKKLLQWRNPEEHICQQLNSFL